MSSSIQAIPPSARVGAWFASVRSTASNTAVSRVHAVPSIAPYGGEEDGRAQLAGELSAQQRWKSLTSARGQAIEQEEFTHRGLAGPHARSLSITYAPTEDGGMVATGGTVQVDLKPVPGDPEATLRKMQRVRQAALSVAQPSQDDREVAAAAASIARAALDELAQLRDAEAVAIEEPTRAGTVGEGQSAPGTDATMSLVASAPGQNDIDAADTEPAPPRTSPLAERVEQRYARPEGPSRGFLLTAIL